VPAITPSPGIQFRVDGSPATNYDFGGVAVGQAPAVDLQVVDTSTATISRAGAELVPQGAMSMDGLALLNASAIAGGPRSVPARLNGTSRQGGPHSRTN
jgi:hypothetical protein